MDEMMSTLQNNGKTDKIITGILHGAVLESDRLKAVSLVSGTREEYREVF